MLKYFLPRVSLNALKSSTSRAKIKTVFSPLKEKKLVKTEEINAINNTIEVDHN